MILIALANKDKLFNSSKRLLRLHRKKNWSHFDLKSWVTGGTEIRPGIQSTWVKLTRYWESKNWRSISSQFDSNILQLLLGISGQTSVPPVAQLFRSKWFQFFFRCMRFSATKTSERKVLLLFQKCERSNIEVKRVQREWKFYWKDQPKLWSHKDHFPL